MTRMLPFILCAWCAYAQLPPMPVADTNTAPNIVTNHVCPPRLPVIWLSWKAPTNWIPNSYRIYSTTNPTTPMSNYTFRVEVPNSPAVVSMVGKEREYFCITALTKDRVETVRTNTLAR